MADTVEAAIILWHTQLDVDFLLKASFPVVEGRTRVRLQWGMVKDHWYV